MIPRLRTAWAAHRRRVAETNAILAAADAACEIERVRDWQFVSRCRDIVTLDVAELARAEFDRQPAAPEIVYIPSTEPLPKRWERSAFDVTFLSRVEVVAP